MERALKARSMHSLVHELQANTERALNVRFITSSFWSVAYNLGTT